MENYEYEPIKKLKANNKKKMIFVFLTMFMFLGISLATIYFVYRFNDERENTITSGLVDIDFKEQGASINLQNTVPMTDEAGKRNDPYIFTVENISKIPVNLKIGIEIGENTIDLSAIKYALYIDNEEVKVDNLENLDSENNLYIKEQFASGAKIEAKLVFWIDYYYEKSGGSFLGKIKVEGEQYDIIYEETGAETIRKTIGKTGGVIGIVETNSNLQATSNIMGIADTQGDVIAVIEERSDIREYRYSGLDVNNYVTFNDEMWRIIGVFKDENGEHLKIVRNEVIKQTNFPATFEASDTVYNIKSTNTDGEWAFWNKKASGTNQNNDWATAGLQYWLNAGYGVETESPDAGYMSYLSKSYKGMIEDKTKYYLGTVTYYNKDTNGGSESVWGIKDTVNEAYKNERAVTGCEGGIGPASNSNRETLQNNTTCRVWANNQATWAGRIALLYPSDYGYSADSKYWNTKLGYTTFNGTASDSNWLQKTVNLKSHEWLLSPGSYDAYNVSYWYITANVSNAYVSNDYLGVRPTLYLKSNVKINGGIGTQDSPYTLTME